MVNQMNCPGAGGAGNHAGPSPGSGFLRKSSRIAALLLSCLAVQPALPCVPAYPATPAAGYGVRLDGPYMGDADYDVSKVAGGVLSVSRDGRTLSGSVQLRKRGFDYIGSGISFVSVSADGSMELVVLRRRVIPWLSTGISYGRVGFETLSRDVEDNSMAIVQFGAGIGVPVSPGVMFETRYRYFAPVDSEALIDGRPVDLEIDRHNLLMGVRFQF